MTLTVRRLLAATAATASLLALAGCGGDDEGADKASSSASEEAGTDSPEESESPADEGGEGDDAPEGESVGAEEFSGLLRTALEEATTAHMTMELGSLGSGEGDVDYTQDPPEMAMQLTMQELGGDVEMRMVDGTIYMKAPTFGDGWVSISLDEAGALGGLGSLDLTSQFESFAAAVTDATFVGEEDVDGETLDHYTATVDTEKLVGQVPGGAGDTTGMPATMSQDWWFDDDGFIRRFSSDLGGMAGQVDMTMSEWGEEVSIEAPPADEVTPLGQAQM